MAGGKDGGDGSGGKDLMSFVLPIVRRRFPPDVLRGPPLRRGIDYVSTPRRSMIVEDLPQPCEACGRMTEDGAKAGCEECLARSVMES